MTVPLGSATSGAAEEVDAGGRAARLHEGLGFRVNRLARSLRRAWALDLAPLELSPPQAAILRGVNEWPGCSLRAIARMLSADPMNVKHGLDELEDRGLIRSGVDPADRRRRTLTATPAGEELVGRVDRLAGLQQARLESALEPSQLDEFNGALVNLERALGISDAGPG